MVEASYALASRPFSPAVAPPHHSTTSMLNEDDSAAIPYYNTYINITFHVPSVYTSLLIPLAFFDILCTYWLFTVRYRAFYQYFRFYLLLYVPGSTLPDKYRLFPRLPQLPRLSTSVYLILSKPWIFSFAHIFTEILVTFSTLHCNTWIIFSHYPPSSQYVKG